MPTALPIRDRRLPWPHVARLVILVARVRLLDWRLNALADRGADFRDARPLRLSQRWLAGHEAIGRLLPEMAEPQRVRQARAILAEPDRSPQRSIAHAARRDCIRTGRGD